MKIEVKGVRDPSKLDKERIVLSVLEDDEIGSYVVFDTTYVDERNVSNKVRHSYWFPDKAVKAGDLVVLYTKKGISSTNQNTDGSTTHFFYMGLDETVWNKDGDCAVLLHADDWRFSRAIPRITLPKFATKGQG